jgi:hypothetical protein
MEYQANACPAGRFQSGEGQSPGGFVGEEGVFHTDADAAAADGCPFCADTVAYRRFLARDAGRPYQSRSRL